MTTYIKFDALPAAGTLTVTEIVPIEQGGVTAQTTVSAMRGTTLTNPMTTVGDVIIGGTAGAPMRLGATTDGYVFTLASGSPIWAPSTGGGGGGQSLITVNAQTGSYTLLLTDFPTTGAIQDIQVTDASASTITIPPHSSVAAPVGSQIMVSQWGAGAVTIAGGAGVTLVDAWGAATTAQYDSRYARQVATDTWQIL